MIALTLDNKPLVEFQKQAESLADSYMQALVEEGIPLGVAEKLTIDKTVDLCRKNTKSAEVKAVLSATSHTNATSVIAKMVTQMDSVRQDRLTTENTKNKNKPNGKPDNSNANNTRGRGRGRGHGGHRNNERSDSQQHGNGRGSHNGGRGRGRGRGHFSNGRGGHYNQGQFYQPFDQQVLYTCGSYLSPRY